MAEQSQDRQARAKNARICMICWLASAERVQRRLEQQRNGNLVPNCGMRCRNGTQDFARTARSECLQGVVQQRTGRDSAVVWLTDHAGAWRWGGGRTNLSRAGRLH